MSPIAPVSMIASKGGVAAAAVIAALVVLALLANQPATQTPQQRT